eukprot:TRINITY_DN9686_c0_g1_i3.p2 TRINITY_DN9686_c0_g1~~TRINITY_DN9686_c0_g1_i3.p2  ORF type:complete len:313 (-),score=105.62 TRINITY_DN9686_c0_g1_i3:944-1882(-)
MAAAPSDPASAAAVAAASNSVIELRQSVAKIIELRNQQGEPARQAAAIAHSRKRKLDAADTPAIKHLKTLYDQMFTYATEEFFLATAAQNIVLGMLSAKQALAASSDNQVASEEVSPENAVVQEVEEEDLQSSQQVAPQIPVAARTNRRPTKHDDMWNVLDRPTPLLPGAEVAALIDENSDPHLWILATVQSFEQRRKRYKVVDADPSDDPNSTTKKNYTIGADKIIAIPSVEEHPIQKRTEFQAGEMVLAIFPETSVFYHARVIQGPKKLRSRHYTLEFHDDNGERRKVDAKYVVPLPERYYNSNNNGETL